MNTKSKVLLAEDDLSLGYVIKDNLLDAGYDVVLCADGQAAIDKFSKESFDICLLDVMMPNKDGFAVAKKIRQQTDQIPILLITAKSLEEDRIHGFECGADDYIVKPFSMQELVLRLRAVLRRATPVELRLPPEWLQLRDQFRVWNSYAEIHLARGEWRDCLEVSRSILHNCEKALSPGERAAIYQRLATCSEKLGDVPAKRAWQDLARAL